MDREDVADYMDMIVGEYRLGSSTEIPDRFKALDSDGDGDTFFRGIT